MNVRENCSLSSSSDAAALLWLLHKDQGRRLLERSLCDQVADITLLWP